MADMNTVLLEGSFRPLKQSVKAGVAITPGHIIEEYNDSGTSKVRPDTNRNAGGLFYVALEDALIGRTIDDEFAIGETVRYTQSTPGKVFNMLLAIGENVTKHDPILRYGDGTVAKAASSVLANIVAPSTTLTSWTTAVAFDNGTVAIPAGTLKVGDQIRVRGKVRLPSTNSTDTFTGTLNWGATALITTAALDGTNDDVWLFDEVVTIRTIGASGTFTGSGRSAFGVLGTATFRPFSTNSTAVDTTAAVSLTVKMACSNSSSSNQAILEELTVEHIKAGATGVELATGVGAIIGEADESVDNSAGVAAARLAVRIK